MEALTYSVSEFATQFTLFQRGTIGFPFIRPIRSVSCVVRIEPDTTPSQYMFITLILGLVVGLPSSWISIQGLGWDLSCFDAGEDG